MVIAGLLIAIIPLVLILVLAFVRKPDRLLWLLQALAFGMVLCFLFVSARWDLVGMSLRWIYPALWIVACALGYRRIRPPEKPLGKLQKTIQVAVSFALIVFMSGFLWFSFRGYRTPANAVDLASPLRNGQFVVLHGGGSPFTNGHFRVRPQSYALDILGLNGFGVRSKPFGDPHDLNNYSIYGALIHSPCDGSIILAVDEFDDQVPPAVDTQNIAGNHVLIDCLGVEVLLAHMMPGSIRVRAGDSVTVDTVLGAVGNSGNTSEPHLHIHAEKGGEPGMILNGSSVPITIDGRYLVRGDTFGDRPDD